jgi:hypothetical protein
MEQAASYLSNHDSCLVYSMRMNEVQSSHRTMRKLEDHAFDLRRITALEKGRIQPAQKDRGEVLKALIAASGGKMRGRSKL